MIFGKAKAWFGKGELATEAIKVNIPNFLTKKFTFLDLQAD
jgi:hypothetical protein